MINTKNKRNMSGANNPNYVWSNEDIFSAARESVSYVDFKNRFKGAYCAAYRRGIFDEVKKLLKTVNKKWGNKQDIRTEALKHNRRVDFENACHGAYNAALKLGPEFMEDICSHMPPRDRFGENGSNFKWKDSYLAELASRCLNKDEFYKKHPGPYQAACKRGLIHKICNHMPIRTASSSGEIELMGKIKEVYENAKKHVATKIKIKYRPYIHRFHLDIYIPELKKGIEYDGIYHHSLKGLARGRKNWPVAALKKYHEIKDLYFLSQGIQVLHINEKDWLFDKEGCIRRCLDFLKNNS